MKLLGIMRGAVDGWRMILRGEPGWQQRFSLSAAGLVAALVVFYIFAFLAVVLASFSVGVPTLDGFINIMIMQTLWLVALWVGTFASRFAVAPACSLKTLLVPGIYALVFYLVLGALVSMTLGALLPLLWIALAYALYRLGRVAAGWSIGVAAAFGILTVLLLVGLPVALYVLASTFTAPAA